MSSPLNPNRTTYRTSATAGRPAASPLKRTLLLIALVCMVGLSLQADADDHAAPDGFIRADRLGVAHISAPSPQTPTERYQQALWLGAGWNRWPIYWNQVEATPDRWNWTGYDRQFIDDLSHGLQINAIFLGIPPDYREGESVLNLHAPIFADGTDTPAPGKAINPDNHWAEYIWRTVNRYKPGGLLGQIAGLPPDAGIRVWEVWNEPDLIDFWRGGPVEYARLLKVSYIVTKLADPDAQVMFGGLLYPTQANFLAQVLNVILQDPDHEAFDWYFDLVGVHSYLDPWRSGWLTLYARQTMIEFGFRRPIWLNESGVPVWDDYPGPTWNAAEGYATMEEQAAYFIQSSAFAWYEGAEKVFIHQLYDDCGNQPPGTNFSPHDGELCIADEICYGDSHGIFRNMPDSVCFAQHPEPGTPRPVALAYRLMASVFGVEPFERGEESLRFDTRFGVVPFERPRTGERVLVMWNRRTTDATIEIEALGTGGRLLSIGTNAIVQPEADGFYRIPLPPAQASDNQSEAEIGGLAIGGLPYILIERRDDAAIPVGVDLPPLESAAWRSLLTDDAQ